MPRRLGCPILAAVAITLLGACAAPTAYQPRTDGEGYSEQRIEEDRYRVSFSGNSVTPRETVENAVLVRAAELTRRHGYDYFMVLSEDVERETSYRTTYSPPLGGHLGCRPFCGHTYGGFVTGTARPIDRYTAYAAILLRRGGTPDDPQAYDAREVLQRLRPQVIGRADN